MKKFILLIFSFIVLTAVQAQLTLSSDAIICDGGSTTLLVLASPSVSTESYTIESIPFAPETHSGTNVFPSGDDDIDTGPFSIGFDFCFFGEVYDQVWVSTNGWLSFENAPSAWNTVYGPGGTPSYSIPNTNANVPKNCIFGAWQDWDPDGCSSCVKYQTIGTAPNRRFVVSFQDLSLFLCSPEGTFQIVIYETTNRIETHIESKPACTGWESGKATQGIHKEDGSEAVVNGTRNASTWTASDESIVYLPSTIVWSVSGTAVGEGDSLVVSPTATTTYTATVVSCDGVTFSEDVTVFVNETLDASFSYSTATYCGSGTTAPTTIASSGGVFSVSPAGLSVESATGLVDLTTGTPGTIYTITYSIVSVCPSSSSTTLVILPFEDASFSYSAIEFCQTGSTAPSYIATSGGVFEIDPTDLPINAATGLIDLTDGTPGTLYTVTYTTSGACPSSDSVSFTLQPLEDASFAFDDSSYCPTGTALPVILGTSGGIFTVSPFGIDINALTGQLDLSSGTPSVTYTITYTTAGFCSVSSSAEITITPLDDASFAYDATSFCPTGIASPSFITTSGGTFSIDPADITIDFISGELDLASGVIGTTYFITYTTPVGPCQNGQIISVSINPLDDASFNYSSENFCPFGAVNPLSIVTPGGTFSASPAELDINAITGEINLESGIPGTTYTITYTTAFGPCSNAASQIITIEAITDAYFSYSNTIYCSADAALPNVITFPGGIFSASVGVVINAITGEIDLENSIAADSLLIFYTSPGCGEQDTFTLTIHANPIVVFASIDQICKEADAIILNATPFGGYFTGDGVNDSLFNPQALPVGDYPINYTFTDVNGCSASATATITVVQNTVNAGEDVAIFEGTSTVLNAEGGVLFEWIPPTGLACTGCQNTSAGPLVTTQYTVTSFNELGCLATDSVLVTILPYFDPLIFVPNTFTPNGDGVNDYLFIFGPDIISIIYFRVFDRWGNLIWETQNLLPADVNYGWDGTGLASKKVSSGVYAFTAMVVMDGGAIKFTQGNVTIIK